MEMDRLPLPDQFLEEALHGMSNEEFQSAWDKVKDRSGASIEDLKVLN